MANGDNDEDVRQLHDAFFGLLIDNIRADRYPSVSMMDMVEAGASQEQLRAYTAILIDKFNDDRFPSIGILRRLAGLV